MKPSIRYLTLAMAACLLLPGVSLAATATRSTFGFMPDGQKVEQVKLHNKHGVTVTMITYGARVQSIVTPDRNGHLADIALGYSSMKGYLAKRNFFGATIGRYANRIADGTFTLDNKTYHLTINDYPNSLHGGVRGFDTRLWKITSVKQGSTASVTFRLVSPDGDQGYPGRLTATATYALNDKNQLVINLRATTSKPTIVNMTNHTYWNLNGEGSGTVMHQVMMIPASQITPVDETEIPTGAFRSVAGTPFDFRQPKAIGKDIRDGHSRQLLICHGYDMNYVISHKKSTKVHLMARVYSPRSGRVLTMYSNQPGLQFYSGNFLNGSMAGVSGHIYRQGDAFVLEPQVFPDTPNHPNFPSAVLKPGQVYHSKIIDHFSVRKKGATL